MSRPSTRDVAQRGSAAAIAICIARLDHLIQSVSRLQKAHAARGTGPADERSFHAIRLAKAAIDADYQTLRAKLIDVRSGLADDEERSKSQRRRELMDKVFPR
jgi:hypothetical protein